MAAVLVSPNVEVGVLPITTSGTLKEVWQGSVQVEKIVKYSLTTFSFEPQRRQAALKSGRSGLHAAVGNWRTPRSC